MSVEEASIAFARICESVLGKEQSTPVEKASKLEEITKNLLEESDLSAELRILEEPNPSTGCKLGIFYMAAVNMGRCALFRNYESRQTSYNPTIVEAMRVVWATPGLFPPVHVGPKIMQEELVSATSGFNNPTLEVLKEAYQAFGPETTVSCLLSLGAGRAPIRSVAIEEASLPIILQNFAMDCEKTAEEVERRVGRLGVYFRFSVDRGLDFGSLSIHMGDITAHTGQYLLDEGINKNLDSCIRSSDRDSRITLEQIYHARARSSTSLRGLPPLSAFFVTRPGPMNAMITNLIDNKGSTQHIMILAGMGGSGKTQLTLKFARDFEDSFQPIMFIDASSVDTIKKGLFARIRALGREYAPETVEEALEILMDTDNPTIRNWLIIYDNADDPGLDLRPFIPICDNGAILITTRNTLLRDISPEGYLELDVMSVEEAITALLQAALPAGAKPTLRDREAAATISQQLGYLPIAIVQAGCYIRQQNCLYEYEDRLKANRKTTLERPAKNQRDVLKYGHSVYAALNISLEALSKDALHILSLLSSVHFANFPRPLIAAAAKSGFSLEIIKLLDRPATFQATINFLNDIFCPNGSWDENILANSLDELQQYSLVSLVSSVSAVTFRLHPLVHSWAQDRLSLEDQEMYRTAAVRLIACAASQEKLILYDYLTPQIMSLSAFWPKLHVNDRIALLRILDDDTDPRDAPLILERAQGIYDEVKGAVGESDIRALRAALFLASAYGGNENMEMKEKMETRVLSECESQLGKEDLETATVMLQLAETYVKQKRYSEAEKLLDNALKVRQEKLGERNIDTADIMETMAQVYLAQGRSTEAQTLFETVLKTLNELFGRTCILTISTMMHLADILDIQNRPIEANTLRQETLALESSQLGTLHIGTLWTMAWAGGSSIAQGNFTDGLAMLEQALAGFKELLGVQNSDTLDIMGYIAEVYRQQGRLIEAETLWKETIDERRSLSKGKLNADLLNAIKSFSLVHHTQGRFKEAEALAREAYDGQRELLGDENKDALDSLQWLGRIYLDQRKFAEAEEVWEELIPKQEKVIGENNPDTINTYFWIGRTKFDQKRWAEAGTIWSEVYEKRKTILGEKHPETMLLLQGLSNCAFQQGQLDESASFSEIDVALRTETLEPKNVTIYEAMERLISSYQRVGRLDEAENIANKMVEMAEANLEPLDLWRIRSNATKAYVFHFQGRFSESATLNQQVLKDRITQLGETHVMVARSKSRLAITYEALGSHEEAKALAQEAVVIQRKELAPDNFMLIETLELLKKFDARADTDDHGNLALAAPIARKHPIREDTIDIDGYKSAGNDPQQSLAPPRIITRPISPFEQRNKFGRSPNPRSMFM